VAFKEINPTAWQPTKEGDNIEGVYLSLQNEVGINKSKIYNIATKDGIKSVWGSAILDSRMTLVKTGDKLRITYMGLGKEKAGQNAPKIFKVEVDE
jgi:hypothetical protein